MTPARFFFQAELEIGLRKNIPHRTGHALVGLANVNEEEGMSDSAIYYNKRAKEIGNSHELVGVMARSRMNLGNLYLEQGQIVPSSNGA